MVKRRVIETDNVIQNELHAKLFDKMMRGNRDRGRIGTREIIKAGIKHGLALEIGPGPGYLGLEWLKETEGTSLKAVEISPAMIAIAKKNAAEYDLGTRSEYVIGDAQELPFDDNTFDVVINECAVGIPDDSQMVLNEMVRVVKPGGVCAIHESTWRKKLSNDEKEEISERYGTTPLEYEEWIEMLQKAGVKEIITEFDEWSKPEMFYKIRKDRDVEDFSKIYTPKELGFTIKRITEEYGQEGVKTALENQKVFVDSVLSGKIGYCLYKGIK